MTAWDTSATDVCSRGPVPAQFRLGLAVMPGDRIVRQLRGIDAWKASMRLQEALLCGAGGSRRARMDGARRLDVLRRTNAAVAWSTARELARVPAPMLCAAPTAVIAHNHPWFRDTVSALLARHGFEVVEQTDNGADALGAIIAEQPDLVLVGERLAMMTGADLLSETGLLSPLSVLLAQADEAGAPALRAAGADAVLLRQVPPADVADDAARLVAASVHVGAPS